MENGRDYDETYDADYDLESDFDEIPAAELDADQAILSVPVPPPEPLPENEAEEKRQKLKRELREEALARMEASARTEQDFREVVSTWDHLDKNRERKERSHELLRGSIPLEYKLKNTYDALVFPDWKGTPLERQLAHGNFIDFFADCPYEMHNLTAKTYIWKAVRDMKEEHKELLYFMGLKYFSPQRMAVFRGQTDRNIRKVRDVMYRKLRKKLYQSLTAAIPKGYKPSIKEKRFMQRYENGMEEPDEYII